MAVGARPPQQGFKTLHANVHIAEAREIHRNVVRGNYTISGIAVLIGMAAVVLDRGADSTFDAFGVSLQSAHIGVAVTGLGLVMAFWTMNSLLRNIRDLGALPGTESESRKSRMSRAQAASIENEIRALRQLIQDRLPSKANPPTSEKP
ncbi:hypothetical protein HNR46_000916 [Haloferula luteola]|uniref:Uncharacterized protein n=1 Tax=Haloferula luteola TaxID=595692 RepID=A0A840V7H1_9BACT|nr:hypothetical protein [Haloferula luteola]MBB5350688.1 hypothetical protein [Haloferula luteola]